MDAEQDYQRNYSLDGDGTVREPTAMDFVMVMRVILRIHFAILIVASIASAVLYMKPELMESSGFVPKDRASLPAIGLMICAIGLIGSVAIRRKLLNVVQEGYSPVADGESGVPPAAAFTAVAVQMLIPHIVATVISAAPIPYLAWSMKVTDQPVYFGTLIGALVLWHLWNTPTQRRLLKNAKESSLPPDTVRYPYLARRDWVCGYAKGRERNVFVLGIVALSSTLPIAMGVSDLSADPGAIVLCGGLIALGMAAMGLSLLKMAHFLKFKRSRFEFDDIPKIGGTVTGVIQCDRPLLGHGYEATLECVDFESVEVYDDSTFNGKRRASAENTVWSDTKTFSADTSSGVKIEFEIPIEMSKVSHRAEWRLSIRQPVGLICYSERFDVPVLGPATSVSDPD